ncbi:MAG: hypothetical protein DRJ40_03800 [Thermoprotei archaeon]|nr:MAG: hypothetical protein DRJ40_03800 [Thermoprotei archaeon]
MHYTTKQIALMDKLHRLQGFRRVLLSDYIPFRCMRCGFCCREYSPNLTLGDIYRISTFLGISPVKFIEKYCVVEELLGGEVIKLRHDKYCILLRTTHGVPTCCVYSIRPLSCRLYPLHYIHLNVLDERVLEVAYVDGKCIGVGISGSNLVNVREVAQYVAEALIHQIVLEEYGSTTKFISLYPQIKYIVNLLSNAVLTCLRRKRELSLDLLNYVRYLVRENMERPVK